MKVSRAIMIVAIQVLLCAGAAYAQEEGVGENSQNPVESVQTEAVKSPEPVQSGQAESANAPEPAQSGQPETAKAPESVQSGQTENAAPQEPVKSRQAEGAQTEELMKKIEELEGKLNQLTEESSARKKLEITEEEKQQKEKDILEAVGTDYTLETRHTLSLDYTASYSYAPGQRLRPSSSQYVVEDVGEHTVRHTISVGYGLRDNMNVSSSLPFVYRYNKMGTTDEISETDIGDMTVGVSYQPFKTKAGELRSTFGLSATLPTGRSPYEINPDTELNTGDGIYSISVSGSFSQEVDPVVVFGNLSMSHGLPKSGLDYHYSDNRTLEKVVPGDSFGVGIGLAYAMSYKVSINSSFNYSYKRTTKYTYKELPTDQKSGDDINASLSIGVGWRINQKTMVSYSLGYTLTGEGGFSVAFRIPFSFVL